MRSERGQVTVLALGLAILGLAIAGLAVDGTKAWLLRRTLQNAADSAGLAAAGELDETAFYRSGGNVLQLDPERAAATAGDYLAMRGVEADVSITVEDEEEVRIVLRGKADTLFLALIGISKVPVAIESASLPVEGAIPDG
jgi:hypothetical protein